MTGDAVILARIVEYNTDGENKETIDRNHIGTIVGNNSQFSGELDAALAEAVEEGFVKEPKPGQYVSTDRVNELIPGKQFTLVYTLYA